jgi:hypothetical protein
LNSGTEAHPGSHRDTEALVLLLLEENPDAIRLIREREPKFSKLNADIICSVVPTFSRDIRKTLRALRKGVRQPPLPATAT